MSFVIMDSLFYFSFKSFIRSSSYPTIYQCTKPVKMWNIRRVNRNSDVLEVKICLTSGWTAAV